ncbi:MAG: TIGR00730 family Rossman fold protein [Ktedonobacterales bacterium]
MRRVCVFAGSSIGTRPAYGEAARALGMELARRGLGLVYGGSCSGLMGVVADAALAAGGEVIGVMPRGLFRREVVHPGLTELREVGSMHERKALMAELADGFLALPGGFGTFDELFEMVTWAQIGVSEKPIGLLDVADYFTPLLALVEHAACEGFVPASNVALLLRDADPNALLDRLAAYTPPSRAQGTWLPRP